MITWDVSPEIFKIPEFLSIGPISIRYYGVLFAVSFLAGLKIMEYIFKKENKSDKDLNDLFLYMFAGTVIGARLGHVLFYDPVYYLSHPLMILEVWKGGLASHGAAIGIPTAIYMYSKKRTDQSFLWVIDRIVIVVALAGFFIRLGNLFNSEIIGTETSLPWGFVFVNALPPQTVPRHPAQLYESIAYLVIFFVLFTVYRKKQQNLREGFLFGIFLVAVFSFRFLVEFVKDYQEPFEQNLPLKMGQFLSIPLIILGIYILMRKKGEKQEDRKDEKNDDKKNNVITS